ncbi:hypothetical protein DL98DRAFT_540935 [Cadophora sp. DSE1049]|nr:hypothetical protein DL98DRAFT_540935 [Cadophora sp. DSE1049]
MIGVQTKQADGLSFTRLYFAGHASVFNQPEAALRMQQRTIAGLDIATGKIPLTLGKNVTTKGPRESTFREGPATVQLQRTPLDAVYDPITYVPVQSNVSKSAEKISSSKIAVAGELTPHPLAGMTIKKIREMANGNFTK